MVNLRIIHRYLCTLVLIIIAVACRPKYSPEPCFATFNDFENIRGWQCKNSENYNSIVFDFGKNSLGSIYLNKNANISVIFNEELYKLTNEKLHSIKIYSDIKHNFTLMDSCCMVCSITNNKDEVLFYEEYNLKPFEQERDWVHISKVYNISEYSQWDYKLRVYFFNKNSSQKIFVDNIGIELYSFPIKD